MATATLTEPVVHPSAWIGSDLARREGEWIYRLKATDLAELAAGVDAVRKRGIAVERVTQADFPLPTFGARLQGLLAEVQDGRGFVLIRGLDDPRFSREDLPFAYWGIGTHLGTPATQNAQHHLLGHVRDEGRQHGKALDARGYHSNTRLDFHTDGCEMVGLLCLHPSKTGGKSSLVSAGAVYNEMQHRYPQHMPTLYRGYHYIKREAVFTGEPFSPHRLPVFGHAGGLLSCRFVRPKIDAVAQKTGTPMPAAEVAALDAFEAVASDQALRLDMDFRVGDIQLANNYTVLHARTEFEDWPEPERKRHLLRLWLTFSRVRPLPDDFPRPLGYGDTDSLIHLMSDWRERQAAFA